MVRTIAILVAAILCGFAAGATADSPATGKWSGAATDGEGQTSSWILVVKDDAGKLSGTLTGLEGSRTVKASRQS
jgi:hypothetical protein